jgi:hypothetical protein
MRTYVLLAALATAGVPTTGCSGSGAAPAPDASTTIGTHDHPRRDAVTADRSATSVPRLEAETAPATTLRTWGSALPPLAPPPAPWRPSEPAERRIDRRAHVTVDGASLGTVEELGSFVGYERLAAEVETGSPWAFVWKPPATTHFPLEVPGVGRLARVIGEDNLEPGDCGYKGKDTPECEVASPGDYVRPVTLALAGRRILGGHMGEDEVDLPIHAIYLSRFLDLVTLDQDAADGETGLVIVSLPADAPLSPLRALLDGEEALTIARARDFVAAGFSSREVASALNTRGYRLYKAKDFPGARAWFERAISVDAEYAQALYNAACAASLAKDTSSALGHLRSLRALPYPGGEPYLKRARTDKDLSAVRAMPEGAALLSKASP